MRRFLITIFSNWISLLVIELALKEVFGLFSWMHTGTWEVALLAALLLTVFNMLIRPILMVLCIPLNMITFGLFSIVINAVILMATAYFVPGFIVEGFFPQAIVIALVMGICNSIVMAILKK